MFPKLRREKTLEEYYEYVRDLTFRYPRLVSAFNLALDKERPVMSLSVNKGSDAKQRILFTAMNSGVEY